MNTINTINMMKFFTGGKNSFVHNWMEKLYESIGGKDEFNMKNLQLLPEDIDKLEKDNAVFYNSWY